MKGYRKGDAGTYEKQALVIINHSNASGKELLLFSNFISEKVLNTYDIKLENEVNIYWDFIFIIKFSSNFCKNSSVLT